MSLLKKPAGVTFHVTLGTAICLPGEVVMTLAPGAQIVVGSGLAVGSLPHMATLLKLGLADAQGAAIPQSVVTGKRNRDGAAADEDGEDETPALEDLTFIVATVLGPVRMDSTSTGAKRYYIPSSPTTKRYIPRKGDAVVGVIMKQQGQSYAVNIGAPHPALLGATAFDGATKNNKPKLRAGDSLYCHVSSCEVDLDVELSCCAPAGLPVRDWVTGEALFGPLKGGTIVHLPLQLCKDLYSNKSAALAYLGDKVPFEICIGLNARAWIKPGSGGVGAQQSAGAVDMDKQLRSEMSNTVAIKRCLEELAATNDAAEATSNVTKLIDDLFGEATMAALNEASTMQNAAATTGDGAYVEEFQDGDMDEDKKAGAQLTAE